MEIATTTLLVIAINLARGTTSPQVAIDPVLNRIAEQRCVELTNWSHDGFKPTMETRMLKASRTALGENLAFNIPNMFDMVKAFENSPTHKENNQNPRYTRVGYAECTNTQVIADVVKQYGYTIPKGVQPKTAVVVYTDAPPIKKLSTGKRR